MQPKRLLSLYPRMSFVFTANNFVIGLQKSFLESVLPLVKALIIFNKYLPFRVAENQKVQILAPVFVQEMFLFVKL